jgi:hypothetical protein
VVSVTVPYGRILGRIRYYELIQMKTKLHFVGFEVLKAVGREFYFLGQNYALSLHSLMHGLLSEVHSKSVGGDFRSWNNMLRQTCI